MASDWFGPPSVFRNVTVAALGMITLAAGIAFTLRGGTGTSTYIDYKREIVTCTDTGGKVNYPYCNWQEPVNDAGSGSIVTQLYYTAGKVPATFVLDGTVGKSLVASGSLNIPNFNHINTITGSTVLFSSGSLLVGSGAYVRLIVPSVNPTLTHTASMEIEYYTRVSR